MIDRKIVVGVCCLLIILLTFALWLWVNYPQIVYGSAIILVLLGSYAAYVRYKNRKAKAVAIRKAMKIEEEKRKRREQFEQEQRAKGLKEFVDKDGNKRWETPEQVQVLQRDAQEQERLSKGIAAREREITVKQLVNVRCSYCRQLYEESLQKCPNCGAPR